MRHQWDLDRGQRLVMHYGPAKLPVAAQTSIGYIRPWWMRPYPLRLKTKSIRRGWFRHLIILETRVGRLTHQEVILRLWWPRTANRVVDAVRRGQA